MIREVKVRRMPPFVPACLSAALAIVCSVPLVAHAAAPSEERPASSSNADSTARESDEIIASINRHIRQGWADTELKPSEPASDGEWLRRLYLDVIGRIPTYEETTKFLADKSSKKRAATVDELLESETYAEEYVRNWATYWTNLLIGRTGGTDPNDLINREGMQQYLRRSFARNKPYDVLVTELVTATGRNTPGDEEYNGAVNFLVNDLQDNAVQATAKTARLFLGVQVQCTQCHHHPFNTTVKQDQFWRLNAFFRQAQALRKRDGQDITSVRLVDSDFAGEGRDPKQAETYFEERNGLLNVVYPTFLDGQTIPSSGYVDEVVRRQELAKLMVASDYLPKALVNRYWGRFLGYGFTKPVDDMGEHNAPSHPELLDELAGDFAAHQFDLKQLIRWIVLSEPYSLSSQATSKNEDDDPALGATPQFTHFYLRQMGAEELYESLASAMRADETVKGTAEEREKVKQEWLSQFAIAFGTDENDEATTFNGTIPQTLMMMNGDLVKQATSDAEGSFLARLAKSPKKDADKIRYLYISALSRVPTRKELGLVNELWKANEGNTLAALQDTWWSLLNSNEFILNH
jgi:hypothetical protein